MTTDLARAGDGIITVGEETLKYLGLDPNDVKARAIVLACQRYGLDPLLGHIDFYKNRLYISRDGMLHVAHESGQLDGIVVEEQRQSEHGWSATVTVWRKDMSHPFTYKGGCGIDEPQAVQGHGAEMALARAERRALRRAFNIPAVGDEIDDPILDDSPVTHEMLTPRSATHRTYDCTCGERFATQAAFAAHKKIPGPVPPAPPAVAATATDAGASGPPLPAPTGPGPTKRARREDQPPPEYYDSLPESRNLR
jgi:hypothetical protein